jgi:hypothetical protein
VRPGDTGAPHGGLPDTRLTLEHQTRRARCRRREQAIDRRKLGPATNDLASLRCNCHK